MKMLVIALSGLVTLLGADKEPSESQINEIISKFAAKESEFARARENYTYRQTVRVLELDDSGNTRGRHEILSDIIFSPDGKRTEKVVRAPVSTLKNLQLTQEDEQDLRSVQPFVLTSADVDKYHVRYLGKETLDEIPCFVFAVKPKKMEQGQRYFSGLIYVDDRDLQIVKSYGRATGLLKKSQDQQFPKFETYREQIDGKYWFPTYTTANDVLMFQSGPQPIRMTVRYEDYKQFKSEVKIKFEDQEAKPETKPPSKKP
ncbi:MAG: hypothetical protein HY235_15905 [Acidobacteria bacterium]|nr:hypothetical protein [Acidobacteriota bacterium]